MKALRREHPSIQDSGPEGLRAKALRPGDRARRELRPETREAASAYERAARLYEARRATHPDALAEQLRAVRQAAAHLLEQLRDEAILPPALSADLERWVEGEFAGTHVDVELANHAIHALLGSDVIAEVGVTPW